LAFYFKLFDVAMVKYKFIFLSKVDFCFIYQCLVGGN